MSNLRTIVGCVSHVGQYERDEHVHTYRVVEVATRSGREELKDVAAAHALVRAIKPQNEVAMVVLAFGAGNKAKSVILGIYDKGERRVFANEEMYAMRDHAVNQAFLFSFLSIFLIPLGLAFFIVPGLLCIKTLWKAWSSIKEFPPAPDIRQAVGNLPNEALAASPESASTPHPA